MQSQIKLLILNLGKRCVGWLEVRGFFDRIDGIWADGAACVVGAGVMPDSRH